MDAWKYKGRKATDVARELDMDIDDFLDAIFTKGYYCCPKCGEIVDVEQLGNDLECPCDNCSCKECDNKGWILSWNTLDDFNEIQKCDACEKFKTDKEASSHAIKELLTPHKKELDEAYKSGYNMACWEKENAGTLKMSEFSLSLIPDEYREGMSINDAMFFNTTVISIAMTISRG